MNNRMLKSKLHHVTVIIRSCITGRAVWIYRGTSKHASRCAYWHACKHEMDCVRHWNEAVARRKANIQRLLSDCMADMAITDVMTPEQKTAARQLASYSEKEAGFSREFYDHIIEERRRRAADMEIRRKMRKRDFYDNPCYDK